MTERVDVSSGGDFERVFGSSRAVRVGERIHVSGTTAREYARSGDAYEQATAVLPIIETALRDTGSSLVTVVRTLTPHCHHGRDRGLRPRKAGHLPNEPTSASGASRVSWSFQKASAKTSGWITSGSKSNGLEVSTRCGTLPSISAPTLTAPA